MARPDINDMDDGADYTGADLEDSANDILSFSGDSLEHLTETAITTDKERSTEENDG